MRVYEVSEEIQEGCRVTLRPTPGVPMGNAKDTKEPVIVPIGNSLGRLLVHPEDQQARFRLMWAKLDVKPNGLFVVAQEEAERDEEAMVWVDLCHDEEIGFTRVGVSREPGHTHPLPLKAVTSNGLQRVLYVFKKGDGLFLSIPAEATLDGKPKRMVIWWDGQQLHQLVRQLVKKSKRAPRPQQDVVA